ncbi:MAG: hypothetical protein PHR64_03685, partial [Candidatus Shapirobacteria bacterium]|nr:hypothetical protein [Candidatus Shapirobacteria bacterium]
NTATSGHYLRGDGTRFVSSVIQEGDLPSISAAGGWTDDGTIVRLTTSSDKVGIGYANPGTAKLAIDGNVGIGTTNPNNFKLQVAGDVGPQTDSLYNLGSDSIRWANIYADNIYGAVSGSVSFADITSGTNTAAAMVVGTGASLGYSGTGTINASSLQGGTWGAPLGIGTTTPGVGYFTTLSASTSLTTPTIDSSGGLAIGTSSQTGLTLGRAEATTTINGSAIVLGTQASSTTHAVRADRSLTAGSGLTGGGNLTADRTFNVGAGNGISVNADDVAVNQGYNFAWTGTQSWSNTATFNGNLFFGGSTGLLSSTGNVGIGHTSPAFKLQIAGSGNLLSIGDTAGNTFFSVTDSLITSNLPHTFTSSGDVSMAYNLLFTNPTASYIRSSAPLYIEAGETYGSSNLTLRTYNTGNIILESANLWADGTGVGIGTTAPSYTLDVNGDIGIALGSDLYLGGVGLGGTGGAGLVGLNNAGLTYVSSSTVQGGMADLDSALGGVSGDIRWVMTGNSGTPQIVGAGQTASFLGGTGISTSVGATRQLTITNTAPWTDSSGSYIQNQFASAQTGNFWISGTGLVGTRLGVGATHPSYSLYTTGNLGVGGTAYFNQLTASRLVATDANKNLISTISADNLRASVSGTTGTGSLVFGTSPAITTSLTTGSASFDLINTTATTVNFGGAATALNLGATTGTTTIRNTSLALSANSALVNFSSATGAKQIQTGGTSHLALMPGGNVGIGTTGPGAKLDINGDSRILGSLMITSGTSNYTYKSVLHYQNNSANQTGAMVISIPDGGNTMLHIKITGYNYVTNQGAWEAIIGGYWYTSGDSWINTSAEIRGSAPFREIKLMKEGDQPRIVLGNTSTVWQYPQFKIDVEIAGYGGSSNYLSGWSASLSTDLSGLTAISSPNIKMYIDSSGNVGIGTTNPGSYKLNVAGNTYIDGTLTTTGAISAPTSSNTINNLVINSGTITSGTWQATAIGATYGGTGQTAYNTGDLLYASSGTALSKRGIG